MTLLQRGMLLRLLDRLWRGVLLLFLTVFFL
jgi:hypothetical protein